MNLPCLEEMGDIAPALELLLRVQAEYARREPSASRAMRDVARSAVETEIHRYIRANFDQRRPTIAELEKILGRDAQCDAAEESAK